MATQRTITPIDGTLYVERELASEAAIEAALNLAVRGSAPLERRAPGRARRRVHPAGRGLRRAHRRDRPRADLSDRPAHPATAPGEMRGFRERAETMIRLAPEALADVQASDKPGFRRFIRKEPLGVAARALALELPLPDLGERDHPGAARRQRRAAQALGPDPALRRALHRARGARRASPAASCSHVHCTHDDVARMVRRPARQRRRLHRLGRGRPRGRARRARALPRRRPRARRQGPGLRARRRRPRPRGREPGRRRVLQRGPELLRHRADLRARAPLR